MRGGFEADLETDLFRVAMDDDLGIFVVDAGFAQISSDAGFDVFDQGAGDAIFAQVGLVQGGNMVPEDAPGPRRGRIHGPQAKPDVDDECDSKEQGKGHPVYATRLLVPHELVLLASLPAARKSRASRFRIQNRLIKSWMAKATAHETRLAARTAAWRSLSVAPGA